MTNSSNSNSFQTPPRVKKTKDELERMTWAPIGKRSDKIISIPFPMMYQKNRFSTPVKRRRVNPYTPGAPIKSQKRLLQTNLDDFRKELFRPNFSASLRERINEKRKLKAVKSSECPGAPMKSGAKRKSNERDLNSTKKRLFENKEIFSPYSRTLTR
jgi:hypothetical protein